MNLFVSVLSFVCGILVVQQFSQLPEIVWCLGFFSLVLCLAFFRHWRLMFFVIGLLWAICFASIQLADRLPEYLQGQLIQVEGKVVGLPHYDERRVRFDFLILESEKPLPKKIRLSWYFPEYVIKAGQTWTFTVKLKKPHGQYNPGGFDYEQYLFVQNIGATGYVRSKPQPKLIAMDSTWQSFDSLRQAIADKLDALLQKTDNVGLIKALTIGERHNISQQQWEVFRKTGTVHLLAISGLHIGLVSGLVFLLILHAGIRLSVISPHVFAAICSIVIALFYSALAGFSLPTQRALLMLSIAMVAICWQRNMTLANTLAVTMLVVLLFDPLSVLSAGFWLSFLAVALIVYSLGGRLAKPGYWMSALKIHWVTAIGLAPVLLLYFQQVSIIAPLANLVTVPVISLLIVPLCLLAVIVMFFSTSLAGQLFLIINKILQGIGLMLSALAELPYAAITTPIFPFYTMPLSLLGVAILLSPKGMPVRWLGFVLLLPLLFIEVKKPDLGEVVLTLLDVGQGLSAVIETSQHVLVFDTGAKYSKNYDMGSAVVIPFLNSKGINVVDTLLISHGDNDHIGGAESVINQINVKNILTSETTLLMQHSPEHCQAGQSWVWDQVKFDILSPGEGVFSGDNNNSCVLRVRSEKASFLLTGDIEKPVENWLLDYYKDQLPSDVLIAPHHGSKSSSSFAFLNQVKPNVILIPSGFNNRFSFPHAEVMQRYKAADAAVYITSEQGALTVDDKNELQVVTSERAIKRKYWNN